MTMLLGHISSIEAYDLLGLGTRGDARARVPQGARAQSVEALVDGAPWVSVEVLDVLGPTVLDVSRLSTVTALPKPFHLIVSRRSGAHANATVVPHGWSYAQPLSDLVRIQLEGSVEGEGAVERVALYVCPPEMAIMQMARKLSPAKLALLIDQIVGSYRIIRPQAIPYYRNLPQTRMGLFPHDSTEVTCESATVYGLEPLTTVETLGSYVESMSGAWGSNSVRRALSLAANDLASPLEAQQYMLAFCRRMSGSLGLPKPVINQSVEVPTNLRSFTGTNEITPDFMWPESKVVLEVNGSWWHTGDKGIADTSRRQKAYEGMGMACSTITSSEMYNIDQFNAVMEHLARLLGHRLPDETDHFRVNRTRLRTEVLDLKPRSNAVVPAEDDEGWLEHLLATN